MYQFYDIGDVLEVQSQYPPELKIPFDPYYHLILGQDEKDRRKYVVLTYIPSNHKGYQTTLETIQLTRNNPFEEAPANKAKEVKSYLLEILPETIEGYRRQVQLFESILDIVRTGNN